METRRAGFTLIELLVVISIIGLLSSVVLASVNSARMTARDSQKIQELVQIRTALELYRSANNAYPESGFELRGLGATTGNCDGMASFIPLFHNSSNNDWIQGLTPQFYKKLPGAGVTYYSSGNKGANCYVYMSDGVDYKLSLLSGLEATCKTFPDSKFPCAHDIVTNGIYNGDPNYYYNYTATIYTPGAQDWVVYQDYIYQL